MAQLTDNMKYEFPQELWGIIKEYAGVYHIGTNWTKLEKIGVETIHNHYKDEYNRYITNYKTNVIETKKMIFEEIFNQRKNKNNMIKLYKLITDKYPKNKVSNFECKVGDQICYCNGYNQLMGVVTKINKSTVSFKPYKIDREVRDLDAISKQTFEYIRYYFDKNKFEKVKTIKNFNLDNSDYFEKVIDWGR
tara:strand:- start:13 stop:588 length:576 start_codon:yes stop_codon:yes gene_type:complete